MPPRIVEMIIDADNDIQHILLDRRRDHDIRNTVFQIGLQRFTGLKGAGAIQNDVDTQVVPGRVLQAPIRGI